MEVLRESLAEIQPGVTWKGWKGVRHVEERKVLFHSCAVKERLNL